MSQGLNAAFCGEDQGMILEPALEQICAAAVEFLQALSSNELGALSHRSPTALLAHQLAAPYPDRLPAVSAVDNHSENDVRIADTDTQLMESEQLRKGDSARHSGCSEHSAALDTSTQCAAI